MPGKNWPMPHGSDWSIVLRSNSPRRSGSVRTDDSIRRSFPASTWHDDRLASHCVCEAASCHRAGTRLGIDERVACARSLEAEHRRRPTLDPTRQKNSGPCLHNGRPEHWLARRDPEWASTDPAMGTWRILLRSRQTRQSSTGESVLAAACRFRSNHRPNEVSQAKNIRTPECLEDHAPESGA